MTPVKCTQRQLCKQWNSLVCGSFSLIMTKTLFGFIFCACLYKKDFLLVFYLERSFIIKCAFVQSRLKILNKWIWRVILNFDNKRGNFTITMKIVNFYKSSNASKNSNKQKQASENSGWVSCALKLTSDLKNFY